MFVVETARFLADFYELEVEDLAKQTTQNFLDFFKLSLATGDTMNREK
jgi:Tat protein secretion system quality control protein TatD with DNase activity